MSDISLEIHHLDVRGGDATAVIVKEHDGDAEKEIYRVLIDAGAEGHGSSALKHYLETYLPGEFDLIVATHYHKDHIQGFAEAGIVFKRFLDIGNYKDGFGALFTPRNGVGKNTQTLIFGAYQKRVQTAMVADPGAPDFKKTPLRVPIPFIEKGFDLKTAAPVVIQLGEGTGITLTCHCANGILADGTDVLGGQKKSKGMAVDPNDVSLALVLEWGDFRYLTAGDLSGDPGLGSYYNVEKDLVDYLAAGPLKGKRVTVFKASHHGSEHSNQQHLLDTLKPATVVVCCNIGKHVPSPVFLKRLKTYFDNNKESNVVFTNTMKVFKNNARYEPLEAIKDFIIPDNVVFEGDDKKNLAASNLGVKCVVVRRRVRDGKVISMGMPARALLHFETPALGYNIVLMKRDPNDAKNVSETVKFTDYDMRIAWLASVVPRAKIFEGFTAQAKEMARWLKMDVDNQATEGNDYLIQHYPGLIETLNDLAGKEAVTAEEAAESFSAKMQSMFNDRYAVVKDLIQPKPNNLTNDERMTLFRLLKDNYYQAALNYHLAKGFFDRDRTWNSPGGLNPEPYRTGGQKRAREHSPEDRKDAKKKK